ncbi:MAG: decaprenyl-phosphate phosphoribosyltransferase [Desulfuromonadaceae bacterium]|nr:decaprenyl-phosphate phosphoribosyltransferase [Desulfuromonadaceae bacterium]
MLFNLITLLRVRQWLKNLMLFFAPFLGGTLLTSVSVSQLFPPFCAFCLVSSFTYICNDILDKKNDLHHPDKCTRVIASGKISISMALVFAAVLLIISLLIAWNISYTFLVIIMAYVTLSFAYSAKLKDIILLDIFCISTGFLLRLQAGGEAFSVPISEWLFTSVFLLSVFLSAGKRLAEKLHLGEDAHYHRKALTAYPMKFLEWTMYMTGSSVLVTYALYAISRHSLLLLWSVPLCCFGLLRYLFRIRSGKSGDPTESLVRDMPLMVIGVMWISLVGWGIYGR